MVYTLGEAAKATGKSKTTISKAIKNGKISASKLDNGQYQIDPAELHRVYPLTVISNSQNGRLDTPKLTPEIIQNNNELAMQLKLAEARLSDKEEMLEDLKQDRDKWRQQATALLEHKQEPKGFWARLIGK